MCKENNNYFEFNLNEIHLKVLEMERKLKNFEQGVRIGYAEENKEEIYSDYIETLNTLKDYINTLIENSSELKNHLCEWDDEQYCMVCGCDGRA